MTTNIDPSLGQPRDNGAYAARQNTAPPASVALRPSGDLGVHIADILPGDTVFAPFDGRFLSVGTVIAVQPHPEKPEQMYVRFADGAGMTAEPDDIISVHRSDVAPDYNVDADYYVKLEAAHHILTTAETLLNIVENEAEDDFMLAVATHPNASAEAINRASHHSSWAVRAGALANPNTDTKTVRWLRDNGDREAARFRAQHEADGICPGTSHTLWNVDQALNQASAARAVLLERLGRS